MNSIKENVLERLSGADFDSDTMLLTDNQILIRAAKRNYENFPVPTKLVEGEAHKRKYTDAEKADLDIKTSVNKIGEIINLSQELNSILWDRLYKGASIESVMDLYCDIAQLDVMSNLEIDSAKRENPADNTFELQCLKKKYDVRDNKNRHVRPMFFKYIDGYKGYRDDYYIYCEEDDEFVKRCVVGTYKEAKAIKESNECVCIERGRMSYVKYSTSMDYLESCINKFKMPRKRKKPMSFVLVDENEVDGKYSKTQETMIVNSARQLREDTKGVWGDENYSSKEKRDIERHLFLLMMDGENYQMRRGVYSVLQNSSTPIPLLNECKSGDVQIYDYTFRKEMKPMPYDNQDEFRKYVKDFLDEYGLQVVWFANHVNYVPRHFSSFINGNLNISKSKRIEIYRKIIEYKDRISGF